MQDIHLEPVRGSPLRDPVVHPARQTATLALAP